MIKTALLVTINVFFLAIAVFWYLNSGGPDLMFSEYEEYPFYIEYTNYTVNPDQLSFKYDQEQFSIGYGGEFIPVVFTVLENQENLTAMLESYFQPFGNGFYNPKDNCDEMILSVDYERNSQDSSNLHLAKLFCVEDIDE